MAKMDQPTIETERLILRPYSGSDVADIFAYASNPDVAKYVTWQAHESMDDSVAFLNWIEKVTCNEPDKIFFVFAIFLKSAGKVIGSIDFKNTNAFGGQMDYVIGSSYWGQGIMSESAQAVKKWAFDNLPQVVRLQSFCIPENLGSRRVMEKVGMSYEGLRRKSIVMKGQPVDVVHYALVRELPLL